MPRRLFLLCFLLLCLKARAQQTKRDSLQNILQRKLPDSARLMALVQLADLYKFSNYDSALLFSRQVTAYPEGSSSYKSKMFAYNTIGSVSYFQGAYLQSMDAFKQYHNYAFKINDKANRAIALNNQGNVHIELGEYDKALEKYQEALQLKLQVGNPLETAMSYNNIGFVYKDLGDYEKAVQYFLIALKMYEERNSLSNMAYSYNYLGAVLFQKKDYPSAISYHAKALEIQQKLNNKGGMGISLQSLANIYGAQQKYKEALAYFGQAQKLYEEEKDLRQLALINSNIGTLLTKQKQARQAIPYYHEAIRLNQQIGNRRSLADIWLQAASVYISVKDLPAARSLIDSAQALTKLTRNKEHLKSLYEVETEWHSASGNYSRALDFSILHNAQKDTLLNEAGIKALTDMQIKYETEKKEKQIVLLSKDNSIKALEIQNQQLLIERNLYFLTQNKLALSQAELLIAKNEIQINNQDKHILLQRLDSTQKAKHIQALGEQARIQQLEIMNRQLQVTRRNAIIAVLVISFVSGLLIALSYYRRYRLRQAALLQEAVLKQQAEATRAVLEAEETERQRIAKDLHDTVGQMMSAAKMNLSAFEHNATFATAGEQQAFQNIISLVDESCREVRQVSHNMMPNALMNNSLAAAVRAFLDKLDHKVLKVQLYTEGLDERLDSNTEAVLYRVVQECVNNVIKHAQASLLDISLVREANEISATIEDNGIGFTPGNSLQGEGMGLKNLQTRVAYLKGKVDFDSSPGRGTLVAVHVPL